MLPHLQHEVLSVGSPALGLGSGVLWQQDSVTQKGVRWWLSGKGPQKSSGSSEAKQIGNPSCVCCPVVSLPSRGPGVFWVRVTNTALSLCVLRCWREAGGQATQHRPMVNTHRVSIWLWKAYSQGRAVPSTPPTLLQHKHIRPCLAPLSGLALHGHLRPGEAAGGDSARC